MFKVLQYIWLKLCRIYEECTNNISDFIRKGWSIKNLTFHNLLVILFLLFFPPFFSVVAAILHWVAQWTCNFFIFYWPSSENALKKSKFYTIFKEGKYKTSRFLFNTLYNCVKSKFWPQLRNLLVLVTTMENKLYKCYKMYFVRKFCNMLMI